MAMNPPKQFIPRYLGNNGSYGNGITNGNTSHDDDSPPGVELYTLCICVSAMLAFGLLGTLSNLALLLSTKCKRSIRSLQYGLPYCLATANLLLCLVWVPVEVMRLILNFTHQGVHNIVCYSELVLFYFCVGMIVFLNVFISIHRLLLFLTFQVRHTIYAIIGIILSISLSGLLAGTVVFEYDHTRDYTICTQLWLLYPVSANRSHLATMLVNLVWVIALTSMSVLIAIIIVKQRQLFKPVKTKQNAFTKKLNSPTPIKKTSSKKSQKSQRTIDSYTTEQDQEDSKVTDRDGSSCKVQFSEPSSSKEKIEKSSSKNLSFTEISRQFFFGRDCRKVEKNDDNDSDLDDDEFEEKMKLKLQKSLSGRRHTVANIGFGESLFGRSNKEPFGGRSTSPNPTNYQYVRKWSIDITALQDQLENPKSVGNNAFSDLQLNRKRQTSDNKLCEFRIEEEKHEEEKHEEKEQEKEKEEENCDDKIEENDDTQVSQELLPVISDDNESNIANSNNTITKPGSFSTLSKEIDFKDKIEEVDEEDEVEEENNPDDLDEDDGNEEEGLQGPAKTELIREIQINTISLLLTLTVLVCILPFTIIQLLQAMIPLGLNRNLSAITAAIVLIQTPIHTLMIAWMERKIWQALRKLRIKLTHWKCVCYCNIGKGRQCFGRPHYNGKCTTA